MDPEDAAEAKYQMDRGILLGRELTVVFAEENRKKPTEMRARERTRSWSYDYRSPLDIPTTVILDLHPPGILISSSTADRSPVAIVIIHLHPDSRTIRGLFLPEMEGSTVDGLTLVHLPTAGQGAGMKTMQGYHHTEKDLYL